MQSHLVGVPKQKRLNEGAREANRRKKMGSLPTVTTAPASGLASHQTGWTSLIAFLIDLFARVDAKSVLETKRGRVLHKVIHERVAGEGTAAENGISSAG